MYKHPLHNNELLYILILYLLANYGVYCYCYCVCKVIIIILIRPGRLTHIMNLYHGVNTIDSRSTLTS